jgi:CBS domain-containing protein
MGLARRPFTMINESPEEVRVPRVEEGTQVSVVMHRGVVSCDATASGLAVARIMAAHRIHSVVVTTAGDGPRVMTDAEVGAAVHAGVLDSRTADELAKASPLLRPSDSIAFALDRMHELGSTHAVVVGRSLRPLGVISVLDIVEMLLRQADHAKVPLRSTPQTNQ